MLQEFHSVQEVFADPGRWTQGTLARDASRIPINPRAPSATCWCLLGAVHRVYPHGPLRDAVIARLGETLRRSHGTGRSVGAMLAWNDSASRSFVDVLLVVQTLDI